MLATKISRAVRPLRHGPGLKEALSAELELENGQLLRYPAPEPPGHQSGGLAASSELALKEIPPEAQPAVSKARNLPPPTAILHRHWQRKSSLEEVMLELYYGSLSVAKADECARLLWGEGAGSALVGEYAAKISGRILAWLEREISEPQVYVFLHSLSVKQKIGGENRSTSLYTTVGVDRTGTREVLSIGKVSAPGPGTWLQVIAGLKRRGLQGTTLFIGDNDAAAAAAVRKHFPGSRYQGNLMRLEREVLAKVRPSDMNTVMTAFETMRTGSARDSTAAELAALTARLVQGGAMEAAGLLENAADMVFSYFHYPQSHWPRLHDIEPMRQILHEFRAWIRVIGPVPDDLALVLLAAARLRTTTRLSWVRRRYLVF